MKFGRVLDYIKDCLFPIFCVSCGKEGEWWCKECEKREKAEFNNHCPYCDNATIFGEPCFNHLNNSILDGISSFFVYSEKSSIGRLIKMFKYNYARDIENIFARILFEEEIKFLRKQDKYSIIPVPLHSRRERERGYNQSEILSNILFFKLQSECFYVVLENKKLVRFRHTEQQAKLGREEREKNVDGAFLCTTICDPHCSYILVDDVFTTGATMKSCARELREKGAKKVYGITLARG